MGAPSEHRVSVTLTGGLKAALSAFGKANGLSDSAAAAMAIAHMLNVDMTGRPLGKAKR